MTTIVIDEPLPNLENGVLIEIKERDDEEDKHEDGEIGFLDHYSSDDECD